MAGEQVFVVVRQGVYDQGVFGVYSTRDAAREAGIRAKAQEVDDYHDFKIRTYLMDYDSPIRPDTLGMTRPEYDYPEEII